MKNFGTERVKLYFNQIVYTSDKINKHFSKVWNNFYDERGSK